MKIAITTDELYPIHSYVVNWLKNHHHEPIFFGSFKSNQDESWVTAASEAAKAIQDNTCDEGIFFCWTGTGISIAANKHTGIRAALCTDAQTATGARLWNHANVLALSNRLISQDVVQEILTAWFEDYDPKKGAKGVSELMFIENSHSL